MVMSGDTVTGLRIAGLEPLDPCDFLRLLFHTHIPVYNSDSARLCHGNRHCALCYSVHAAEIIGILRSILLVSLVDIFTSAGRTADSAGIKRTSSKVRACGNSSCAIMHGV